ncbi:hypothetical protein HMPREF1586_01350 [Gardnerella vaginalis JCP8522]|nr:hypothetical protein HMPREF1586_01350 [Gardnerella vaginalis JCP8522]
MGQIWYKMRQLVPLFVAQHADYNYKKRKVFPSLFLYALKSATKCGIKRRDTREKSFLKKTWENSSKTLKCVFLRFVSNLCVKFTVNSFNLVNVQ